MNLKQFLLKDGPYEYEVKIRSSKAAAEATKWLVNNVSRDEWEHLIGHLDSQGKVRDYVFTNDKSAALYIKLTWG